ncbi:hypothetical protein BLD48_05925 [Exiguobacterium sp. KRL4]|nr:hypothetical protein BLD48_05925 [Exiguobacterium sp. KRL4]
MLQLIRKYLHAYRYRRELAELKRLQREHDENLLCAMMASTVSESALFITTADEYKAKIDELKAEIYGGTK